jgi:predicted  nucleic acid-binding Zn-ribbon protein
MNKVKTACFVALLLPALCSYGDTGAMYRYKDDQGKVVIGYQVPVEDVKKGYEVLNEDGIVIEVVPRELTEEERKDRDAQERLEAEAVAEIERLRAWDESLLLKYSTIDDIEAARKRALSSLLINVSILKSNTRSLKQQVENYQAQAADIERRGGTVDVERLVAIEDLQSEIEATERSIAERSKEMEVVKAEYQLDIERFEQLLDIVELRRLMMVPD